MSRHMLREFGTPSTSNMDLPQVIQSMPFVVTGPMKRSIKDKRKLIRSHVMRGKNRKALPSRPASWINNREVNDDVATRDHTFNIPVRVGGDFSLSNLSAEISSATFDSILRLKEGIYPLGVKISSTPTDESWFEPIWNDPACLHFTIFIAKSYQDFDKGQKENTNYALTHLTKALGILQQRLAVGDNHRSTSDSTILVVVGLTMTSISLRDVASSIAHLNGLHRMVILRGGISVFSQSKPLQTKTPCADLGVSLGTGRKPLFFPDGVSWGPYIASHGRMPAFDVKDVRIPTSDSDPEYFLRGLDARLRFIWDDLVEFGRAADIAAQCKLSIDDDLYHEVMISTHYRLLNLHFKAGTANETIRLALLTLASIFFLQRDEVKFRYEYLARRFKAVISNAMFNIGSIPTRITLWLCVIGVLSTFDQHEQAWSNQSLSTVIGSIGCESWNEVRSSLKSILWVDCLLSPRIEHIVRDILSHNMP